MKRCLIVDDSMVSRMMLNEILKRHYPDLVVTQAASGDAALKAISDIPELDVAILDFNMPGMDGIELSDALVATGKVRNMALLTANVQDAVRERALKRGLTFLNKPITEEPICGFLKTIL